MREKRRGSMANRTGWQKIGSDEGTKGREERGGRGAKSCVMIFRWASRAVWSHGGGGSTFPMGQPAGRYFAAPDSRLRLRVGPRVTGVALWLSVLGTGEAAEQLLGSVKPPKNKRKQSLQTSNFSNPPGVSAGPAAANCWVPGVAFQSLSGQSCLASPRSPLAAHFALLRPLLWYLRPPLCPVSPGLAV
jgi:hypothetical protein